jgi:hypothetical protein
MLSSRCRFSPTVHPARNRTGIPAGNFDPSQITRRVGSIYILAIILPLVALNHYLCKASPTTPLCRVAAEIFTDSHLGITCPFYTMHLPSVQAAILQTAFLLPGVASWPNVPLTTSGRWIQDSTGEVLTYAGVNWPGAADTMIPEGLQYQSIETIVGKIKSLGMNVIRLTFAIEMIDDIYSGGDVTLETSFNNALGSSGLSVYNDVLRNNPSFTSSTTRLQIHKSSTS